MRRFIFSLVAVLVMAGVFAAGAQAQLIVQVSMAREAFLLYEPLPVLVTLRNVSGRPIQLDDVGGRHWLDFTVSDENGREVLCLARLQSEGSVTVSPNQSVTRTIDLMPSYDLRSRGVYSVQAVVDSGGMRTSSSPLRFNITQGREIWTQTLGLPTRDDQPEEYRTFSLQTRREGHSDYLYICVRDARKDIVYGLLETGSYIPLGEPSVRFDKEACLNLLYQSSPRAFGYVRVNPFAQVLDRAVYSDYSSKPELVVDLEGTVTVRGGEKVFPHPDRVLTQEELTPPPPPPSKPKKKWWWPFGP